MKRKGRSVVKCNTFSRIHTDHVRAVIDRMLSGVFNPRSLNPEDDLIDAIDRRDALLGFVGEQDSDDIEMLGLRLEGHSIRDIATFMELPKSTVCDRLARMTWARELLHPHVQPSDPATIGESTRGLHGIKRDRDDERDHRAWISLGNGGYRRRGQAGSDGTQNQ